MGGIVLKGISFNAVLSLVFGIVLEVCDILMNLTFIQNLTCGVPGTVSSFNPNII